MKRISLLTLLTCLVGISVPVQAVELVVPADPVLPPTTTIGVIPDVYDDWQSGNAAFECEEAGCNASFAYKVDNWGNAGKDGTYGAGDNQITISDSAASGGYTFDWVSDWPVTCVIVKGGDGANVFRYNPPAYNDTGLYAPLNPNTPDEFDTYQISHVTFCFNGPSGEPCATIKGRKFHDRDASGDGPDPDEEWLSGWTIKLSRQTDGTWEWIDEDITDDNGAYSFTVYKTGTYRVCEVLQDHWAQTAPLLKEGTECHEVVVGELGISPDCWEYAPYDFGNIKLGSICGYKFKDCNADGIWNDTEHGIEGWPIQLYLATDLVNPVAECSTNEKGRFCFVDVWPGTYVVCEVLPDNWDATTPTCSGDIDVPTATECGWVYDIEGPTFGNIPLGSIIACKFYDYDRDGENDGLENGEGPVPGVQFDLYQNGVLIASLETGDDGCVTFTKLRTGPSYNYTLVERLDLLKGKWEPTTPVENPSTRVDNIVLECKEDASETLNFGNFKWSDETAWAANGDTPGQRPYIGADNWATYVAYGGTEKTTTLFAGQTMDAGTVKFSAATLNGEVTITIELNDGWAFFGDDEDIKVQDYVTEPSGNPAPGLFDWKSEADKITVPQADYYGVHVDLLTDVPAPYKNAVK